MTVRSASSRRTEVISVRGALWVDSFGHEQHTGLGPSRLEEALPLQARSRHDPDTHRAHGVAGSR